MIHRVTLPLLALSVAFAFAYRAEAAFSYYADRAAFEAALGGPPPGFESFEQVFTSAPSVDFPIGGPAEFSLSGSAGVIDSATGSAGSNTHGERVAYYIDGDGTIATFSFASPINAFGLYITDSYSSAPTSVVTVGGDLATTFSLPSVTPTFFGAINDDGTFDQITLDASGSLTFVDFDSVSYGNVDLSSGGVVPEPGSIAVWAGVVGLVGLGAFRRRKRA